MMKYRDMLVLRAVKVILTVLLADKERHKGSGHALIDEIGEHLRLGGVDPHKPSAEAIGLLRCHKAMPTQYAMQHMRPDTMPLRALAGDKWVPCKSGRFKVRMGDEVVMLVTGEWLVKDELGELTKWSPVDFWCEYTVTE